MADDSLTPLLPGESEANAPRGRFARAAPWIAIVALLGGSIVGMRYEDRFWWCACDDWNPWSGDLESWHNSKHALDPYALTHLMHGMLCYGLLAWLAPGVPWPWRLCATVACSVSWELFENSPMLIRRYHDVTAAIGYEGDSVANSLGDTLSCALGFFLARWLGLRWSVIVLCTIEIVLLLWIRDNMMANILMLFHPIESIKQWQLGR